MDYEKKYNEALKWMRELYPGLHGATKEDAEHFFPELRESEDERIRKELVALFIEVRNREGNEGYWHDLKVADILAYLEKQKPWSEEDERMLSRCVKSIESSKQFADSDTFKKAKDNEIDWLKSLRPQPKQKPAEKQDYSGLNDLERAILRGFLCAGVENVPVEIIKDTASECIGFLALIEPDAWSEEDEDRIRQIERITQQAGCTQKLQEEIHDWLKSLRPQQKQEWSDEDERIVGRIQMILEFFDRNYPADMNIGSEAPKYISWLKSLRPSWKPSEEQMKAIESCFCEFGEGCPDEDGLRSLYNDLKKLMML